MARVIVQTDSGNEVWRFHESVDAHTADMIPSAPTNAKTHELLRGLARAVRDAEMIAKDLDPERPSEKAMRLADEQA